MTYRRTRMEERMSKLADAVGKIRIDATDAEIVQGFRATAEAARRRGILELESELDRIADPAVRRVMSLILDGTDPEIVRQVARNLAAAAIHRTETFWRAVEAGALGVQSGDNPRIVSEILRSIFGLPTDRVTENESRTVDCRAELE